MALNGAPLPIRGPKQRALLVLLLLNANEIVSRDRAIDFLWAEAPPESAVNALQVGIHALRQVLGADRIETRGSGYRLRLEPDELDLLRFKRLEGEGRQALERGDAAKAAERLSRALGLWRGDPPPDFEELRLGAIELWIEAELALGRHDGLIGELEPLVRDHPFRERLRAHLMLALYRSGRQAEALRAYQDARRSLREELGIEPSPVLRELERAVLRQDPSLALPAVSAMEANLPRPATRMVGRRLEVASVSSLLRDPDVRLLTLTGPGGVGKTRLAIAAAAELAGELEHGVVFVDLAPVAEVTLVEPTIATALGIVDQSEEPTRNQLISRLRGRELLLVLDNFERLIAAAPLVAELLASAPRLRVLATSRTLLRLTGEHEYAVPPLAVPSESDDLAALARNDSVSVFVARARARERDFLLTDTNADAVSAICRRLEGLPLALELAAARVKLLTPEQILDRIAQPLELLRGGGHDLPPRQQALRATIDWSYELLDPSQRSLFAQLAVFAGGCTFDAVERVCEARLEEFAGLLDNSLLRREHVPGREPRFRMLETVREYAGERLEAEAAADARHRHAEYYATLAERVGPDLIGPRAQSASERLLQEHENLRAALAYALELDRELGLRLVAASRPYWETSARGREIRGWLEQAFGEGNRAATRAQLGALVVLGLQLIGDGEYDEARSALEEAAAAGLHLDCPGDAAVALAYLAWLASAVGDYERCLQLGEETIALAKRGHNLWAERRGLAMVAGTFVNRNQHDDARVYLDRSLALAERIDDVNTMAQAKVNSAYGAICAGDFGRARADLENVTSDEQVPATAGALHLLAWEASLAGERRRGRAFIQEALHILRDGGQLIQRADVLSEAAVALAESAPREAGRLFGAAETAYFRHGLVRSPPGRKRYEGLRAQLAADLGEDGLALALAEGGALSLDDAIAEALAAIALMLD